VKERVIQDLPLLTQLSALPPTGAATLVRAARTYQEAVWVAESQPELSWLLLVSSIEVAAGYYFIGHDTTPNTAVEILCASKPVLVQSLQSYGGAELVKIVAQELAETLKSTRKFIDFVTEFAPSPPENRPPYASQSIWKAGKPSRTSLTTIYGHRSKALHTGIPFPLPMCEPPGYIENAFEEIPVGLGTSGMGGSWVHKDDVPMLLHVFEYIVRNALLSWWGSMIPKDKS
jgi:hypothetical protein